MEMCGKSKHKMFHVDSTSSDTKHETQTVVQSLRFENRDLEVCRNVGKITRHATQSRLRYENKINNTFIYE